MSYKIIDNLLSKSDLENIQNIMSGSDFPWFLHHKVKKDIVLDQKSEVYNFQFIHSFYNNDNIRRSKDELNFRKKTKFLTKAWIFRRLPNPFSVQESSGGQ